MGEDRVEGGPQGGGETGGGVPQGGCRGGGGRWQGGHSSVIRSGLWHWS